MTTKLPARYRSISPRPNDGITARQYRQIAENSHRLWARLVAQWGGRNFGLVGWQQDAGTDVQKADNTTYGSPVADLDTFVHMGRCRRIHPGPSVLFGAEIFATEIEVTANFYNINTQTQVASVSMTVGASAWMSLAVSVSMTDVVDGQGDPATIRARYTVTPQDSDAEIGTLRTGELAPTDDSAIPDAPIEP